MKTSINTIASMLATAIWADGVCAEEELIAANEVADAFELPEEAYFTPKYISNDNRYLIDWEQPENDNNPVLILVEP